MRSDHETSLFWYRMLFAQGYGPRTLFKIIQESEKLGYTVSDLCSLGKEEFSRLLSSIDKRPNLATFENFKKACEINPDSFQKLSNRGIKIVHPGHTFYPENLKQMQKAYVLSCYGDLNILKEPGIAIVGARNCAKTALELTARIVHELARNGVKNIISGLARGVDTKAHISAMEAGIYTTAVLSSGIQHFLNNHSIPFNTDKALVVSQFQPDQRWHRRNAMMRNELVCALAEAVIVVESGPRKDASGKQSGTFAAAETALRLSRPVYVVHPSFFEAPPRGNVELLKVKGIQVIIGDISQAIKNLVTSLKAEEGDDAPDQLKLPFQIH
ncbi:MAG TPA: hypothetical protein DHV12_09655 [Thermotogae bacterium]|nr:hypothetical protein [Thermotogota bacterium]